MVSLRVKELLKEKDKTKYWLVKQMDSNFQSVTDMMENKTKGIKFETIDKLCAIFECMPNDLFKIKKKQ